MFWNDFKSTVLSCHGRRSLQYSAASIEPPNYYNISGQQQASIFAAYAALIAAALYAVRENNRKRKTPRQLEAERNNPWYSDIQKSNGQSEDGVYDDFFADVNNSNEKGGKFW